MSTTVEAQRVYDELTWLRQAVETLTQKVERLTAEQKKPVLSTTHAHIARVQGVKGGEPIIRGTGITVQTIVVLTQHGLTPEQIVEEYEGILTLAEVHDALGYYYDHPGEIEQYIAENRALWSEYGRATLRSLVRRCHCARVSEWRRASFADLLVHLFPAIA